MKKKGLLALITNAFFILSAYGTATANREDNSWSNTEKKKELVVAASGTLFPTSYYNDRNELVGYDVDLAKEVAKWLNVEISFEGYNVDGQTTSVSERESDFAAGDFGITEERGKRFSLSETFKYSFDNIIVRKRNDSGIHSLENLRGKKAAGEPNTSYMRLAEKHGAKLAAYNNATSDQYLGDVANGRTGIIPSDYYLQKMAISALSDIPVKILENIYFNENESGFLLEKGNDALKEKIDGVLKEMEEDGTTKKISEKYFQTDVSVEPKETMTESMSG